MRLSRVDLDLRSRRLAMRVHNDHLDWQRRVVLDVECRSEGDNFDIVLHLDVTHELVGHLVDLGSEREDLRSFTVDRNTPERVPVGVLNMYTKRVVSGRRYVLA